MKKGSPRGKIAETNWSGLAQKPQTGEPNERYSLYRIRRPQENSQLLREDRRRTDCRGRQADSGAREVKRMGSGAALPVAGRLGGDSIQRLDLRHVEALCRAAADGTPGEDESHHGGEEEERSPRCANHRRSAALQFAAGMLRVVARDARSATPAALSQPGGAGVGADAEQNRWSAHGNRDAFRQRETARQEVLCQPDSDPRRSARVSERPAADESWDDGDVPEHAETAGAVPVGRPQAGPPCRTTGQHSRRGSDHRLDLGAGNSRSPALLLQQRCHELLWVDLGLTLLGGQATAQPHLQTAQSLAANRPDRSRQARSTLEPAISCGSRARARTRASQSSYASGGTQAGGLFTGGGQKRSTFPVAHRPGRPGQTYQPGGSCGARGFSFFRHADLSPDGHWVGASKNGNLQEKIPVVTHRSDESGRVFLAGCSPAEPASASSTPSGYQKLYVRAASDSPAGPRAKGDCATELRLGMRPTGCFEAGWFTLTQSSRTAVPACSRKWMSGHAACALVVEEDRGQFATTIRNTAVLGEPFPHSPGKSPFSLDSYLSWMSLFSVLSFSQEIPAP